MTQFGTYTERELVRRTQREGRFKYSRRLGECVKSSARHTSTLGVAWMPDLSMPEGCMQPPAAYIVVVVDERKLIG